MANDVTFECKAYQDATEYWDVVDDACAGSIKIKKAGDKHLPRPNPADTSTENKTRYDQFKKRAMYSNFTGHTLRILVGSAFGKTPEYKAPAALDFAKTDIDGAGVSIFQQSQECLAETLKGRSILLVDYPSDVIQPDGRGVSALDNVTGKIRPTTVLINKRNLKNWRTEKIGSSYKLVLAPIFEYDEEVAPDGFGVEMIPQYRVLRLTRQGSKHVYTQEVWRKGSEKDDWYLHVDPRVILDGTGNTWDYIPIEFVGPNNNDLKIDMPPLYDMAEVNLGHYRNSASYEDGIHSHGEGTLILDVGEISQDEFEKANPKGVSLGAAGGIIVGKGGSGKIVQMSDNSAAKEGMDQKEQQMVALGARNYIAGAVIKTVSEAESKSEVEHSILSLAVSNVSSAYTNCQKHMLRFLGITQGDVVYEISQDFTRQHADAPMLKELRETWLSGGLPDSDYFAKMKKYELIDPDKSNESIKDELSQQESGLNLDDDN